MSLLRFGCENGGLRSKFLRVVFFSIDCHYSTGSAADAGDSSITTCQNHKYKKKNGSDLMLDYLVNSIGLSREVAIETSEKVSHLKSTRKPDFIVNLFLQYGLDQTQIRNVVSVAPHVLLHKSTENLGSNFRAFKELGLSGSDLVVMIKRESRLFSQSIIPSLSSLTNLLGKENLVKAVTRWPRLLHRNVYDKVRSNVLLLEGYGFSKDEIRKLVTLHPRRFVQKSEILQKVLYRVENELGIPRASRMFFHGIDALAGVSDLTMEKKRAVFRNFGWSASDIFTLFRTFPCCLALSEMKLQNALNFYMKELGYMPAYLASSPSFFTYSLESRVKPRNEVLKTLKEHKLVKSSKSLRSLLVCTEANFMKQFVLPYKDKIPTLHETYTNSLIQQSKA